MESIKLGDCELYKGDCLDVMDVLTGEGYVFDAVITDPPYGTTKCNWDSVIPFDAMWERLNKLIKPNGAIVLFGSEPFSSFLRMSNIKNYKYDWYLEKQNVGGYLNAKKRPMKKIELAHVFNTKVYNPQGLVVYNKIKRRGSASAVNAPHGIENFQEFRNYPNNLIPFNRELGLHPTQKPVALLEYLIKTYTDENELVLDFTSGSGSTGVACLNTARRCVLIEKDEHYYNVGVNRIKHELDIN